MILKHVYIERRMVPLNIYLQEATPAQLEHAVIEYGNAIKDLVAANIFPGDMLWKNFGVMRHNKIVFYDYDEIEYITDCNFRRVPPPRHEEDELSGEIWYAGRSEGRLPGDLRPLPARPPGGAQGLHEAPRRPARRGLLAGAQGAHPRRPHARCLSRTTRSAASCHQRRLQPQADDADVAGDIGH